MLRATSSSSFCCRLFGHWNRISAWGRGRQRQHHPTVPRRLLVDWCVILVVAQLLSVGDGLGASGYTRRDERVPVLADTRVTLALLDGDDALSHDESVRFALVSLPPPSTPDIACTRLPRADLLSCGALSTAHLFLQRRGPPQDS